MSFAKLVLWLSAANWLVAGTFALAAPAANASLIQLELGGIISFSDLRAVYGGLRIGIGCFLAWAASTGHWRPGLIAAAALPGLQEGSRDSAQQVGDQKADGAGHRCPQQARNAQIPRQHRSEVAGRIGPDDVGDDQCHDTRAGREGPSQGSHQDEKRKYTAEYEVDEHLSENIDHRRAAL